MGIKFSLYVEPKYAYKNENAKFSAFRLHSCFGLSYKLCNTKGGTGVERKSRALSPNFVMLIKNEYAGFHLSAVVQILQTLAEHDFRMLYRKINSRSDFIRDFHCAGSVLVTI